MLTLWGDRREQLCDSSSRRSFLRAGALGLGGLSLADVLRLRAAAGAKESAGTQTSVSRTSVIFVELAGGPTQFETYDPKPQAPKEYRGPLKAISTSVPGEQFCELLPRQATMLDKLTVIRSIHHKKSSHDPSSHLTQTGYYKTGPKGGPAQMPSFGAVIGKTRGANDPALPAYVAVPTIMRNGGAAHLGKGFEPFQTMGNPNDPKFHVENLSLLDSVSLSRLDDRRTLQSALDRQRELVDLDGSAVALDEFKQQAFDLVTSPQARQAFDISQESDSNRDRYGRNTVGQSMLLARRLVESGVTCVTVRVTGWDDHSSLVKRIKPRTAEYDQGLAALVNDLHERGLRDDVLVIAMGEFGRTPRFNKNAGRDHWGPLMSVLLAGGGLQPGIYGSSTAKGETPFDMPYRPENVLAMLYRHLGIDPTTTFNDFSGRPRYVLEEHELIHEII
ncbi:MAG: DUF1501 domain-containing protein [Planctomycetaceae bacterium]|nr:DUF1501 domain-containing protein [Planctomycetaceae bacterium]